MSPLPDALSPPNGVHTPNDNGAPSSAADSPAIDSPATPSATSYPVVSVKLDMDFPEQESDVRHEPLSMDLEKLDDISTRPQFGTPLDPDSMPFSAPSGTPPPPAGQLLLDVQMAESLPHGDGLEKADVIMTDVTVNGYANGHNPNVADTSTNTPQTQSPTPISFPETTPVPSSSRLPEVNGSDHPPPAKRARKLSDAEQASLAHSPPPSSVPITTTTTAMADNGRSPTPTPGLERRCSTLSHLQHRFCISTIRQLRKLKDAVPFLHPVDPIALNIPHYPSIIKHPMDFSTIDRKLASSSPVKPDPNPNNPRYRHADEFVADVRLIFSNCVTFNGPDHAVTQMGKRVEAVFDKQIKQMPVPAEEPKPPIVKKPLTPPPPPPEIPKKVAARRPSTSVPTIRRSDTENTRPKREIHPPPPKDLPYADMPKKARRISKGKQNDGSADQLKFCVKILADLNKKQYWNIANPFYEPVDWVKLELPTYPKVVKKPMDLSTMRRKLEANQYPNAGKFQDDFRLMVRNCKAFNPPGTPVFDAGAELQRVFDEKWAALPPLREMSEEDEEDEEEESDDEHSRTIAMMESQIESMRGTVAALKGKKPKKDKRDKKRDKYVSSSTPSTSKVNGKTSKPSAGKKKGKKPVADDDVLSFEQKKDLSETIQKLDGAKLEKVISIIHEGVPEIRDSTEEIELDIDSLPAMVLIKLYNFVLRPLRPTATKRNRTGTGTGTGGLKRKSMDEDAEAEKIRQLEERMRLFDGNASGGPAGGKRDDDSVHSTDDSSSDSSGSDSE